VKNVNIAVIWGEGRKLPRPAKWVKQTPATVFWLGCCVATPHSLQLADLSPLASSDPIIQD